MTDDDLAAISDWQRSNLVREIDSCVASPYYLHAELSELLANAGVLPMFGFPTRVRDLYGRWIRSREDLEVHTVSNRPLDQAVANFSPGSQVTREGSIHTCTGFAAYDIRAGRAHSVDPLGEKIDLYRCAECSLGPKCLTSKNSQPAPPVAAPWTWYRFISHLALGPHTRRAITTTSLRASVLLGSPNSRCDPAAETRK